MHDTFDERLSPIRPLLCQEKIKVVGSGFEAITGAPPLKVGVRMVHSGPFEDQALAIISKPIPSDYSSLEEGMPGLGG